MDKSVVVLVGAAALGVAAAAAFVWYRWRQRQRVRRVTTWVEQYLYTRYGQIPDPLSINCSDDLLWPVLVGYKAPRTGIRHNLQFSCGTTHASLALLSEKEEANEHRPAGG